MFTKRKRGEMASGAAGAERVNASALQLQALGNAATKLWRQMKLGPQTLKAQPTIPGINLAYDTQTQIVALTKYYGYPSENTFASIGVALTDTETPVIIEKTVRPSTCYAPDGELDCLVVVRNLGLKQITYESERTYANSAELRLDDWPYDRVPEDGHVLAPLEAAHCLDLTRLFQQLVEPALPLYDRVSCMNRPPQSNLLH